MKYEVDKNDQYTIFKILDHNVNAALAPDLKSQLVMFKNEGHASMIIDMSQVEYIDSSGLSALLTGRRLWDGVGTFVVAGPYSTTVKKIFDISKLGSVMNIVPTLQESIDFVALESLEREISANVSMNEEE